LNSKWNSISNNLFGIKSYVELNRIHKQFWIQLITYYNFYVWNKILNHIFEFNYIICNIYENELNSQSWLFCSNDRFLLIMDISWFSWKILVIVIVVLKRHDFFFMVFAIMGFWILNWTIRYSVGIQGIFDNEKIWFDYWGFVVVAVSEYQLTCYT
jgi:hypothetical protein